MLARAINVHGLFCNFQRSPGRQSVCAFPPYAYMFCFPRVLQKSHTVNLQVPMQRLQSTCHGFLLVFRAAPAHRVDPSKRITSFQVRVTGRLPGASFSVYLRPPCPACSHRSALHFAVGSKVKLKKIKNRKNGESRKKR